MLELGVEDSSGMFNMAHMGLRLAQRANGVAKLHGKVSREMFAGLYPGFEPEEVPIGSVTNGVHGSTWTAREITARSLAADDFSGAMAALAQLRRPVDGFFDGVTVNCGEPDLRANRLRLLSLIRATLGTVADFSRIEG